MRESIVLIVLKRRFEVIPVHPGDDFEPDQLRTYGFAFPDVRAVPKVLGIHLGDHTDGPAVLLRLALGEQVKMRNLGPCEQGGCRIGTSSHTGAASDACRRIHRFIGVYFGDRDRIAIGRATGGNRNKAARSDNPVEGRSIYGKVFHHGKRPSTPWLQIERVAVLEAAHVQLTNRDTWERTVRDTVDHESAGTTNPFAAIVIESNGLFPFFHELVVEHVQHFQERHVLADAVHLILDHPTAIGCVALPPDVKSDSHRYL